PACAAASSSSGLVPTPFSKRVLNEYCVSRSTPLAVESAPLPARRSPCQTAVASRCMISDPPSGIVVHSDGRGPSAEGQAPGVSGRLRLLLAPVWEPRSPMPVLRLRGPPALWRRHLSGCIVAPC